MITVNLTSLLILKQIQACYGDRTEYLMFLLLDSFSHSHHSFKGKVPR